MKVVTIHISLTATRICTILVMLGCVQTYATPSRIRELEKDAVNNSEILEFGTGKENNQGGSPLYTIDYDLYVYSTDCYADAIIFAQELIQRLQQRNGNLKC
ncbi:MAG: hypothetical protein IKQ47_00170 [Prevotella sp.]|nr:hypothetical protein [Prevotella sp.]MBR4268188.1 hypothetical protein [Prevotella sp.]